MSKYRKKPVIIEAKQWFAPDWEGHYSKVPDRLGVYWSGDEFRIHTLKGGHKVTSGDWIITGIKGEKYPCKPDIFEMTYDLVEE